ncbi:UVSB [Aspergillus luchuensis]|uniref:UVSB n=1 Tax=Aspergillus kawachii TaxID=1069201 RepID=A0A146F508_ASPKA|nr:UVSB [Aspergillus luchuensis]
MHSSRLEGRSTTPPSIRLPWKGVYVAWRERKKSEGSRSPGFRMLGWDFAERPVSRFRLAE